MTTSPVPSITDELLAELESKAKAATPGRLVVESATVYSLNADCVNRIWAQFQSGWTDDKQRTSEAECVATAEYVAAAQPQTILALVEHIRSLSEQLEKASHALSRIASRTEAFVTDDSPMPTHSLMVILGIACSALEPAIALEGADHE